MVRCCVQNCRNSLVLQTKQKNVSFFRIPYISEDAVCADDEQKQLLRDRQSLWLQRINRADVYKGARVCSEHFLSGIYYSDLLKTYPEFT